MKLKLAVVAWPEQCICHTDFFICIGGKKVKLSSFPLLNWQEKWSASPKKDYHMVVKILSFYILLVICRGEKHFI